MNRFLNALRSLEKVLSEQKGHFALFAAFLPADSPNQWDLVVSAPWAHIDDRETLDLLTARLKETIDPADRLMLARVVVVDPGNSSVQEINTAHPDVEHALIEVSNEDHFGYETQRGYLITSRDYWSFIKRLFPKNSDFVFFARDGDLCIRVSWHLNDDPARPNKRSRNIIIRISREALDDYLYVEDREERRLASREKLSAYVAEQLRKFDPRHDRSRHATPLTVEWYVKTSDFREMSALA
jgi:hypothetical protein